MNTKQITELSLCQLSGYLQSGEITAVEAAKAYLNRIREKDTSIHAYLSVLEGEAMQKAAQIDDRRSRKEKLSPVNRTMKNVS